MPRNPQSNLYVVRSPEEVVPILYKAAELYYESASELETAWQDKESGRPWRQIAKILESAAHKIETQVL